MEYLEDLVSGRVLPLLHDALEERSQTALGVSITAGVVISMIPCEVSNKWLSQVDYGMRMVFNGALLFRQAGRLDPDVGAPLFVIPTFVLVVMQGTDREGYLQWLTYPLLASAFVVFVIAVAWGGTSSGEMGTEGIWWRVVFDCIYAVRLTPGKRTEEGEWRLRWLGLALRGLFFFLVTLEGMRERYVRVLLGIELSGVLFFFQCVLLLYSMLSDCARFKKALGYTQRSSMLAVAVCLLFGYAFQWRHPCYASYAVIGLVCVQLLVGCVTT